MQHLHEDESYEDLRGLWSDLEAALSLMLSRPQRITGFAGKLQQLERWLQDLIAHDTDAALYLMFQRAASSAVGYSASHALVCASLCHVLAQALGLARGERQILILAALTMNIGMNALQDLLAEQHEPLSGAQKRAVQQHPQDSRRLLQQLHVSDTLWLTVVEHHHAPPSPAAWTALTTAQRLVRILGTVDRYAALISPRKTRAGRSAAESLQFLQPHGGTADEVRQGLIDAVGLYPPGTYVELDTGDIAVVLRRGASPHEPQMASVIDRDGNSLYPPLMHLDNRRPKVLSSLSRSAVTLELDPRAMTRLGMHCAQSSQSLYSMVKIPGPPLRT